MDRGVATRKLNNLDVHSVRVDGQAVGVVRELAPGHWTGNRLGGGLTFGPFPSKGEAVDAVTHDDTLPELPGPKLDGAPLGPSPDRLVEIYFAGVRQSLYPVFADLDTNSRELRIDSAMVFVRSHINLDPAGLAAVYLAGLSKGANR